MRIGSAKRRIDRLPAIQAGDVARAVVSGCGASLSPPGRGDVYYGYGRQALGDAFLACGCKPGDTVLYPDFVCDVTLEPIHRLGLNAAYYPVDDTLQPDWNALPLLAAETGAVAVMSVNYFGVPQPMDRWRRFAVKSDLSWINDNAHGYGSRLDGTPLDGFGDVSFTSMRKVLPLINGAALRVNRPDLAGFRMPPPPLSAAAHLPIAEEFRRVGRSIARALGRSSRRPADTPYRRLPDADETAGRARAMDPLSRLLLRRYSKQLPRFARQRRRLYAAWHERCARWGLNPVFPDLPPETSPMVYPCYAADFAQRQKWLRWAAERNVDAYPWPSLPSACRRAGTAAVRRWQRLLCFPIHPFMRPEEILDR